MYEKLKREISISGKSESTFQNYARHTAHLVLHYGCLPTELDEEQLKDYLYLVREQGRSASFFKFTIYGLRLLFRIHGLPELLVALPSIKGEKKLPVVLSQREVERLLVAPRLLKHRLMLCLLYGCGLRNAEVRALRVEHIDLDRQCVHVVRSKGLKDRMIPLCDMLVRGLEKYLLAEAPGGYLFQGKCSQYEPAKVDVPTSAQGLRWALAQAVKKTGIIKKVNVHTLRHSYATHLLEMGLDIISVKDLMGHCAIETTLVYLQVAQLDRQRLFSPLSRLYGQDSCAALSLPK